MKISERKKKEYLAYLNSPEAKLERFLDKLDEERRKFDAPISGRKHFIRLARRAYNG